jgi:predicted nuclease of predicted toxin-antitoxin system
VRVQDQQLSGATDPEVLAWSASSGRVLLTDDRRTMPRAAEQRLRDGRPMPGLLVLRRGAPSSHVVDDLVLLTDAAGPEDLADQIWFLPL